jgi:hypothetical protein
MAALATPRWEAVPPLLYAVEWEQIRAFFMAEARRLGRNWFGQPG